MSVIRKPAPVRDRGPSRDMDVPEEGYWLIRLTKSGPLTPARIWFERDPSHVGRPIDPWPNSETRILGIFAEVAGKPISVERVWHTRGKPIDEKEFLFLMSDLAWARSYSPTDPVANPEIPVNLRQIPMPF